MTGAEVRAARKRLGLTQARRAKLAGIPEQALSKFEVAGHMHSALYSRHDRLAALRMALEAAGVALEGDEGAPEVKLRRAVE